MFPEMEVKITNETKSPLVLTELDPSFGVPSRELGWTYEDSPWFHGG